MSDLTPINKLTPFGRFCTTIGNLPASYMESLTYEEQLLWFCNFLQNEVIPTVNNNAGAVEELQNLFIELQNYVNNYFENLDVQEEINNKLDEMAENGYFENIINSYVTPVLEEQNHKINEQNSKIIILEMKIDNATSATPIAVSSVEEMTDINKIYVNVTNGHKYYYNTTNEEWVDFGEYQGIAIANDSVTLEKLSYEFKKDTNNYLDLSLMQEGYTIRTNGTINSSGNANANFNLYPPIPVEPEQTWIALDKFGRGATINTICFYNSAGAYVSNTSVLAGNEIEIPANIYYVRFSSRNYNKIEQFKRTDVENYTTTYEPYKYKKLYGSSEEAENNRNNISNIIDIECNIIDNCYIKSDGTAVTDQYSTDSSATDFIEVKPNEIVKLENILCTSARSLCAYDKNKNFVSVILTNSSVTEYEYSVPSNVYYLRATIDITLKNFFKIYYKTMNFLKEHFIINAQSKLKTGLLTWVDDDCNETSIPNVKNLCDNLGIKCSFGLVTDRLTDTLLATLKNYQENGFHITSHTNQHNRWYKADGGNPMFTLQECETDLIKSLVIMQQNGFLDPKYIIAPGSSMNRQGIPEMVAKWAKCFVNAESDANYNNLYTPNQFHLHRTFINFSSHNVQYYKNMIDRAIANGEWIIFGSHSYNSNEFNINDMETIMNYAISQGIEILPLNQAFNKRKIVYEMNQIF